jgi:hypothetical protein
MHVELQVLLMIVDEGYLDQWNYFESEIGFGIEKPKEASMRHAWG